MLDNATKLFRAFAAALLIGAGIVAGHPSALAADFSTLAGSGRPGNGDGPALQASFFMPYGVAVGGDRTIYVSDYLGQRVRAITRDGKVRTVAGSGATARNGLEVKGGYLDGPALSAQFDGPSGIAVDKAGRIFVADSNNRCIRVIQNGQVSTYAGSPLRYYGDGPALMAGFDQPRALALDPQGNLLVGDGISGLRKISARGIVSTVALPDVPLHLGTAFATHITSIVADDGDRLELADGVSILDFDPATPTAYRFTIPTPFEDALPANAFGQAGSPAGYPFGIAHLGGDTFVYTDPHQHAVRMRKSNLLTALSRTPRENDDAFGGGFEDGPSGLVDAPLGIAPLRRNAVVFADSGNRRVRLIDGIETRHFLDVASTTDPFGQSSREDYHILFMTNSFGAHRMPFADSVPGIVERELNAHAKALGLHKKVTAAIAWLATPQVVRNYVENIASSGVADLVVWEVDLPLMNAVVPDRKYYLPSSEFTATQRGELRAEIEGVRTSMRSAKVPLFVALLPTPFNFPPIEDTWTRLAFVNVVDAESKYASDEAFFLDLFRPDANRVFDLWPLFNDAESKAEREPLFTTDDFHLSVQGQSLVGQATAAWLERNIATWR